MSYFSRLTDIVTCNLTEILSREADPRAAIGQIIREMQEGLAGARRSVATAAANVERLQKELAEHRGQIDGWTSQAKEALTAGDEGRARLALLRKQEVADLVAGLEQQYEAAMATREHLATMLRALEVRLTDAKRRRQQLETDSVDDSTGPPPDSSAETAVANRAASIDESRWRSVEAELEALKREIGRNG